MIRFNWKFLFFIFAILIIAAAIPFVQSNLRQQAAAPVVTEDSPLPTPPDTEVESEYNLQVKEDVFHGEFAAQFEKWNNFLDNEVDWSKPAASQIESYRNKNGIPVEIWGDTQDRFKDFRESIHPCGRSKTIFAKSMRSEAGQPFPVGKVVELKGGKIIISWPIPIDEVPLAISKDKILLDYKVKDTTVAFAIYPDHSFKLEEKTAEYQFDPEKYITCPAFEGDTDILSDFTRCYEYRDLKSGDSRILLFEQPCT